MWKKICKFEYVFKTLLPNKNVPFAIRALNYTMCTLTNTQYDLRQYSNYCENFRFLKKNFVFINIYFTDLDT